MKIFSKSLVIKRHKLRQHCDPVFGACKAGKDKSKTKTRKCNAGDSNNAGERDSRL